MIDTLIYPKGTVLLLEEGEYSDRSYCGHLVTVRDLNLREAGASYAEQYKAEDEYDRPDPSGFVAWLVAEQFAMPLDHSEAHIGSYGRLEI